MCYVRHVTKVMILFVQGSIFDIQTSCQSTYGYALLILNTRLLGVFPILWSVREMCCIISMLGRDAHMNAYLTHVEVIFFISHWWIVIVHYNLKERIVKWTHEPRSNFNHKKHLSIAFILLFICSTILIRKYKNIYLSYLHTKPQNKQTFTTFI